MRFLWNEGHGSVIPFPKYDPLVEEFAHAINNVLPDRVPVLFEEPHRKPIRAKGLLITNIEDCILNFLLSHKSDKGSLLFRGELGSLSEDSPIHYTLGFYSPKELIVVHWKISNNLIHVTRDWSIVPADESNGVTCRAALYNIMEMFSVFLSNRLRFLDLTRWVRKENTAELRWLQTFRAWSSSIRRSSFKRSLSTLSCIELSVSLVAIARSKMLAKPFFFIGLRSTRS